MTNRQMKRCSTALIIMEMKINAAVKYHLTSVRMAMVAQPVKNPPAMQEIWV